MPVSQLVVSIKPFWPQYIITDGHFANYSLVKPPSLPVGITISTPPSTPPGTGPDLPASYGISATMPKSEHAADSTDLVATALYGPPPGLLPVSPPPFDPADVERLLVGPFKESWEWLPFNQFATQLRTLRELTSYQHMPTLTEVFYAVSSHDHRITEDMLRSLSYLHQMTGSPMVFGLNSSVSVLMHASYMLSNGHTSWDGSNSFFNWFGVVADMQLLRLFFSQRTPTVTAAWCALARAEQRPYYRIQVIHTWLEIGITAVGGRLMAENSDLYCHVMDETYLLLLGHRKTTKRIWQSISQANITVTRAHWAKPHLVRRIQEMAMDVAIARGDATLMKVLISQGSPIPNRMKRIHFEGASKTDPSDYLEGVEILLKAGMVVDPEADDQLHWDGPGKPSLITDWLWIHCHSRFLVAWSPYSGRMQNCVTVAGICDAASKGWDSLREYVRNKPYPTYRTKQELLQVALSEASAQGREGIVQVLLEYGVDVEVGLLTAREWQSGKIRSYEWLPTFRSVQEANMGMITLLANHGAILNRQEVMDATASWGDSR
ncbi:uncharacterized protein PG986_006497 [Apiospora aurea]|uniref:Clr5 domain-containing protein n=1 Tax=Apiospora aurea TaxID=335848 RepID=A0ABR1QKK9_9PEZI